MKNSTKFIAYLLFSFTITLISSCSKDDPPTLTVNDFDVTIDENQTVNTSLGSIDGSSTDGEITYSINSQAPAGSIVIDANTGEITVANASNFDFETNPTIIANISAMGNTIAETAIVTITLIDIDDIESLLSSSKAAYTAATNGDWLLITEEEYNSLALSLNQVTKVGTSDSDYNSSEPIQTSNFDFTTANDNGVTMPNNSYVFAFKYNNLTNTSTTSKVKQSSVSGSSDFADLGGALPSGIVGDNYLILKGSNSPTTNVGHLGIYTQTNNGFKIITGNVCNVERGNSNTLTGVVQSLTCLYQGLSSTQKQW